jgi:hypothetical protein
VPDYVKNVMNFFQKHRVMLVGTGAERYSLAVTNLHCSALPTEVAVGQIFRIEGVARQDFIGQKLLSVRLMINFPAAGVPVDPDGKWAICFCV